MTLVKSKFVISSKLTLTMASEFLNYASWELDIKLLEGFDLFRKVFYKWKIRQEHINFHIFWPSISLFLSELIL